MIVSIRLFSCWSFAALVAGFVFVASTLAAVRAWFGCHVGTPVSSFGRRIRLSAVMASSNCQPARSQP